MHSYDFKMLNDKEFEILAVHLLSNELKARFERFKAGKDGGIDGRYFMQDKGRVILQCKHWARSSVSALKRSLRATELPKVIKLKPTRYILVTSLELSAHDKTEIAKIFKPFLSDSDIFGCEDLNDLLTRHPKVERDHYKLWLASTNVLETVLHASILGRSDFVLSEIREKANKYVVTQNHSLAIQKLETLGAVLITGQPGIGKTTLAEQLCLSYVLNGFQLCVLSNSIEEAEAIIRPDSKQIFYFDDFLGRNYLEALSRHEDSHIVNFIRRVIRDKTKRFILTSRTTILNQGKRLSDLFSIEKIGQNELEIRVESLNRTDKANILYNHFWHSNLGIRYLEQILLEKKYRLIIDHRNFNPRLIQFIMDAQRVSDISPDKYWPHILGILTNPADVWEHVYEGQLDDYCRLMLLLVSFNGKPMTEDKLRAAYDRFISLQTSNGYKGSSDFELNLKVVVGSVLNRTLTSSGGIFYSIFNPSIADYVLKRIQNNLKLLEAIFFSLSTLQSLENLNDLIKNGLIKSQYASAIVAYLVTTFLNNNLVDLDYRALLARLATYNSMSDPKVRESLKSFIQSIRTLPNNFSRCNDLACSMVVCLKEGVVDESTLAQFSKNFIRDDLEASDFDELAIFRHMLTGSSGTEFEEALRPLILSYWKEMIGDEVREQGILSDFYSDDDIPKATNALMDAVHNLIGEYNFDFDHHDIESIAEQVDVGDVIADNAGSYDGDDYEGYRGESSSIGVDGIDDLFSVDFPEE